MKIKNKITALLGATLVLLTACKDDVATPHYTVGEANNAIVLSAGVSEGGDGVATRAAGDVVYHRFEGATQLRLRVQGTWLGKDNYTLPHGNVTSTLAKQITKASTAADPTIDSDKDNNQISDTHTVSFDDVDRLSWDDYGSADPANIDTQNGGTATNGTGGREKGLTIYGVAVNGQSSLPTALSENVSWTDLGWQVGSPSSSGVIDQKEGWLEKDLLTSNNVTESNSNTYKFDDRSSGKLLEFTHAMTKITVNLTADEGFPGYSPSTTNGGKFQEEPKVTLLGFNYTGTVSVEAKTSTPTASTTDIEAYRDGGATWTSGGQHTTQFTALVFPGNQFNDDTKIIKLVVDGNTLNINAKKINAANTETNNTFEQGKNYIFNIIVKKTGIIVTATVTNWVDVNSEEEAPKINIDKTYGHEPGTAFEPGFTLYRSTTLTGSYIGAGDKADVTYVAAGGTPAVPAHYTMSPQLYWPTHSTHYFFRGVWPTVGSAAGPAAAKVTANSIDVVNEAYNSGHYPSDLMIARPLIAEETATDEACKVHSGTQGICATTGDIRMNFRYMMSQVKVKLTSSASTDPDYIAFDANTKVEIIGGYKEGAIKLSDCMADFTGKSVADYQLNNKANYDSYHDAIIPQNLTEGLKFRITTKNTDGSTDTYEAVIKNIKVKEGTADPAIISAWASGKIYTYNLKITKTAINVTATLTDWVTVTADDNVWF